MFRSYLIILLLFTNHEIRANDTLEQLNNRQDKELVAPLLSNMQTGTEAERTAAYWNNIGLIVASLNALDGSPVADRNTLKGGNKMLGLGSKPVNKVVTWLYELPKNQVDSDAIEAANRLADVYSAFAKHFSFNDGGMSNGELALDGAKSGIKAFFTGQNPFSVFIDGFKAWPNLVKRLEAQQEQLNLARQALEIRYSNERVKFNRIILY